MNYVMFRRLNSFLENVDVGDYYVHGDLEAYSCASSPEPLSEWRGRVQVLDWSEFPSLDYTRGSGLRVPA
jgi:hypothetical protein